MKKVKLLVLFIALFVMSNIAIAQVDTSKLKVKLFNEELSVVGNDVLMSKVAIYDSSMTQGELRSIVINWSQEAFTNQTLDNNISSKSQVFINFQTDFGTGLAAAKVDALMKIYLREGKLKVEIYYLTFPQNGNTVKNICFKNDGTMRKSKVKYLQSEKKDMDQLINSLIDYLYNYKNNSVDDF